MAERLPKILFVDDELPILNGLRRRFRDDQERWEMHFVNNPMEALKVFRATPFEVVITDMMMPEMSGIELVTAMRNIAPESVYIMLTGSSDLQTAVNAVNIAGVFRYYTKPCDVTLLRSGVEDGLTSRETSETASGLKREGIAKSVGLAALDQLALGVVVVDSSARVLYYIKSGGRHLADHDGFELSGNEVCRTGNVKETKALHKLIGSTIKSAPDQSFDVGFMAISRPSMRRPLNVLVTPYRDGGQDNDRTKLAFLFVSDPETHSIPEPMAIRKLFGLSAGEAKIAYALAQGEPLNDAASFAGVTVSTARTYLKQIFSKTDTNRQSELVKLVLTSPRLTSLSENQTL